jgi:hypothetical protein
MGAAGSDVGAQDTAMQDTVEMLVAFVEQSDGPSAAQIVDIAQVLRPPLHTLNCPRQSCKHCV